jgi:23S rRNA (cytosine1962-C5)-methyltransferase
VWFDETSNREKIDRLLLPLLERVANLFGLKGGVVRIHRKNPHQKGLHTESVVIGDAPPARFTVTEHGLKYEISLTETQHTGLFLDQRDTRRMLALRAGGKRVANLFGFTGSFSLAAVAADAEVAFTVDNAKACLETGKTNFAKNGLTETGRGKFIREDARRWLARQKRRQEKDPEGWRPFDLVVCDPPVFASSRDGGQFALEKEWPGLARDCAALMAPGGLAVFANNHRTGDHRFYRRALTEVFSEVTDLRPPLDFPVFPRRPHHVRTFWCVK